MGHTVNFRTYKESYKDKWSKQTPEDEWVIFENTQEPIVDSETWHNAQRLRKVTRRIDTWGEANPLTGLLICADCGAKMYNHRGMGGWACDWKGKPNGKRRPARDEYTCSTYALGNQSYQRVCTQHYIRSAAVRELVLEVIKAVSGFVKSNETEFIRRVRETSEIKQAETAKAHKKNLDKNKKRHAELNTLIKKLYEDYVAGRLTDKRFEILSAEYEREQTELESEIAQMQTELDSFNSDSVRANKFIEVARKYTDFTELTTPMLNEFIEKIIAHEGDKSSGERKQKVDIYLNFIGKFEIPEQELSPAELEEQERIRRKREKKRENNYRYLEKKRKQWREQESNSNTDGAASGELIAEGII